MVICQLVGIHGELKITVLPDSYCLLEAHNETLTKSFVNENKTEIANTVAVTIYGNTNRSCDLQIDGSSSFQVAHVAGNMTGVDYIYLENIGSLKCLNRFLVFMGPLESCEVYFANNTVQLHFRGDIAVYVHVQYMMMKEKQPPGCPEDINQDDMVGALEGHISNCKRVKGFGSVIQCVRTHHWWWVFIESQVRWVEESKLTSRCYMQCPGDCSCMLTDRQVTYNCAQNIQDFSKTSSEFLLFPSDISHLDLSYNGISALTVMTFMSIGTDIRYLDLSSNFLTMLPPGSLDYLYNIIYLDLIRNSLATLDTELFVNLHNLTYLDLQFNGLVTLDVGVFANLHSLTYLYLYFNALVTLDVGVFANLHSLIELSVDSNALVTLDVGVFANLNSLIGLYLSNNSLLTLDVGVFANLHNLFYLHLDQNELVTLETHIFINLHKLNSLYILENKIVELDHRTFNELVELKYLYINKNKISRLKDGIFSNLFLLERLSIAFNRLSFLPFNIFEDLHSLVLLDLSGNRLQTIPQIGHMTLLSKIDLFGNPLTKITKNMFSRVRNTTSIFVDQPEVCICYLNGSDTCFNTIKPSPYLTCDQLLNLTALSVFIWIIGCSAIIGNIFVLWWKRFKQRVENKVQSLLLSNLAMSDLVMGIYMIIIAFADVYYGQYFPMNAESWRSSILCRIAGTLAITSSEASVLFVTFISIDRCITIKFPYSIHKLRVKSTRLISALVWAFSLTLGLTASILAGRSSDFYDNSHVCIGLPLAQVIYHKTHTIEAPNIDFWKDAETVEVIESSNQSPGLYFSVAVFIAFNMFCFLLILACYIGLIRAVSKTSSEAFRQREMAEEIRMTLKVSAIVLTDFFCWFPICLMGALVQIGLIALPNTVFAWAVTFILPINSAINPFLYTIVTVITNRCLRRAPDPAHIQMQTQSLRVQSTKDIAESQSERVGRHHVAPLAEAENTTA